jgi:NAD(P)-dependent dehydrogenase (short-subunit alcohol dehydrogenase family)
LEIVRQLAQKNIMVILTARDAEKGSRVADKLEQQGFPVRFHELDVRSAESVDALGDFLEQEFGRCDILVNNAGIFPDITHNGKVDHERGDPDGILKSPIDKVRDAMETNVYGPILLCQRIVPLMKKHKYGRIVNMSSGLGQLGDFEGDGRFLAYRMSKTAINMLTKTLSVELKDANILVNSVCPGWCKTDMGGPHAEFEPSKGAETPVWLATLPDKGSTGGFFRDKQPIAW